MLYVADIGSYFLEELDIARTPGKNYGWPCVSAVDIPEPDYYDKLCPGVDIPSQHYGEPILWYSHWTPNPNGYSIGYTGNCISGVAHYTGTQYPAEQYQLGTKARAVFYSDYGGQWIRTIWVDDEDNIIEVAGNQMFAGPGLGGVVDLEIDPVSGDLFYVGILKVSLYSLLGRLWRPNSKAICLHACLGEEFPSSCCRFGVASSIQHCCQEHGCAVFFLWLL